MSEYHKIITVWERDTKNRNKTLLEDAWATPELDYLKNNKWIFTEKVDGTNIRIEWNGQSVKFGGKTDDAQLYAPLVEWMQQTFTIEAFKALTGFDSGVLYGEGYGNKIQSGGKYRQDVKVVLFDAYCGGIWLRRESVADIASKFSIEVVPIVGSGTLYDAIELVRTGYNSQWGDFIAEGLVMRPEVELYNRRNERIITKIKYKDFH